MADVTRSSTPPSLPQEITNKILLLVDVKVAISVGNEHVKRILLCKAHLPQRWKSCNPEVLSWLVRYEVRGYTKTNAEWAVQQGNLTMLHWLYERGVGMYWAWGARPPLDVVKWLHEIETEGCTRDVMDSAAEEGHLELVKWLHENRTEGCTTHAMDGAAGEGHLDVVKWLHANRTEGCTTQAMDDAVLNGHLDVVNGHLEVVKWLHENRTEGCTTEAMDYAARNGHLDVVKWLHKNRDEGCTKYAMT
ncbi:hypothetical protein HKX48_006456 [Thoreauomyces humboldtii]|nr:hypothetical protein HKX48_006456 [Thoreauomyces humboldtii]